jgi:hypothetical protein
VDPDSRSAAEILGLRIGNKRTTSAIVISRAKLRRQAKATMVETPVQTAEPPIITVGELKAELNRWPDHAAVTFRCPLHEQEFRFYRFQSPLKDVVEIELNQYPETPVVPSS